MKKEQTFSLIYLLLGFCVAIFLSFLSPKYWQCFVILYISIFACGAVLHAIQSGTPLTDFKKLLSSKMLYRWFRNSCFIIVMGYVTVFSDMYDPYSPDIIVYVIAFLYAGLSIKYLLDCSYKEGFGYFFVACWLTLFLFTHHITIDENSLEIVSTVYYILLSLSVLFLVHVVLNDFTGVYTALNVSILLFALRDVYCCQILPHLEAGSQLFMSLPWLPV